MLFVRSTLRVLYDSSDMLPHLALAIVTLFSFVNVPLPIFTPISEISVLTFLGLYFRVGLGRLSSTPTGPESHRPHRARGPLIGMTGWLGKGSARGVRQGVGQKTGGAARA